MNILPKMIRMNMNINRLLGMKVERNEESKKEMNINQRLGMNILPKNRDFLKLICVF